MKKNYRTTRLHGVLTLAMVTLAILFWAGIPVSAQSMPSQDNDIRNTQLANLDQFLDSHPEISAQLVKDPSLIGNKEFLEQHPALQQFLQNHPGLREEFAENPNAFMRQEGRFERHEEAGNGRFGDRDTTRVELANMDQFLDRHPEISEQLAKDPSLIRDKQFVEQHPDLQQFLQNHPGVREEFRENPNAFMRQEQRFDRREERTELANMDRFLDSHPEISEQLAKDPSLIQNKEFVEKHPQLQEFLQQHPEIRQEFRENPNAFMRQEQRFDRREERAELAITDRFLDTHPEISEQLAKNPSLIQNKEFVEQHPQLQEFLQQHPEIRQEFRENPNAFMRQEQRFDRHEERGELANMDRFLDSHAEISEQLAKNPSLIQNKEFVDKHPQLQEFLQQHPEIRQEFRENPNAFMQQEQRFERREDLRAGDAFNGDMGRGERMSFGQFLSGHSGLGQQLSKDPSLINNKEWLQSHPELGEFLKTHPAVKEQFAANPAAFMNSMQASNTTATPKTVLPPKHKQ